MFHVDCKISGQERRTKMRGTRHSEEQIIAILKQAENGRPMRMWTDDYS